ncbi:ABC-ATPase domain-containing protein [Kyrpidia sp.]|uniref:ABC-ATPase domain-containing protein n=1 Tax=Kyrpidia sp. TaxID=2073077 RepID=UPI002585D4CB|nr:ABC-ATPase domain-containing protein [Kyrpidia sp.]MCL6576699.1 ABC-ATPase domain-containing protein [Kyrpidia sp.]
MATQTQSAKEDLRRTLERIDGRGYPAYRDLEGTYRFEAFQLVIEHVQSDPFAPPSRFRVEMGLDTTGIPEELYADPVRRTAMEDFILRTAHQRLKGWRQRRGSGKSGLIEITEPSQVVIPRSAVEIGHSRLTVRFVVGLPARGRTVLGRQAQEMILEDIPAWVEESFLWKSMDQNNARDHVALAVDQAALRRWMAEEKVIAFVADGAILPRESGQSDKPMGRGAVPFRSPESLRREVRLPSGRSVAGMAILQGITLICGGGYHGKSTLLRALEQGVYNHIAGDGREWVLTDPTAVKIRAEDGRWVRGVDISPFINDLPYGKSTDQFTTESASGATSQAANIMEAVEIGAATLLIDEDTSATNFMIRDARMQALVAKEHEPITPFIDRVRQLFDEWGVSTVLVVGGAGDYLDVADAVIAMESYIPKDVTEEARRVVERFPSGRKAEAVGPLPAKPVRKVRELGRRPKPGDKWKVEAKDEHLILYGRERVLLQAVEQLVEIGQTRAIAACLRILTERADGRTSLAELVRQLLAEMDQKGFAALAGPRGCPGNLAMPRPHEVAAAVNRLEGLKIV